jgi:probable F420-dependent oxidoreductase
MLPLQRALRIGIQTMHRRTEPAIGPWRPRVAEMRALVELIDRCGYDSMWVGDHVSFPIPFLDPLLQIAQAAAFSSRLGFGTDVYLLPLRHPAPVAKQVATLDHLTEGRFIFGVGAGGEFPKEYEVCGVPIAERGARLGEAIEVLRKLWSGESVSHQGRFFSFQDVPMQPPARTTGGPPLWCGGRSEPALARAGRLADGWVSYAVTPEMFMASLEKIEASAVEAGRTFTEFGTGHLLFARVGDDYEQAFAEANRSLSVRYAMDFTKATQRYAAIGRPQQVAKRIRDFFDAGARHIVLDLVGPYEERDRQIERIAAEVLPLLVDIRGS